MQPGQSYTQESATTGMRSVALGLIVNILLAITKGVAGVLGHSNALIADAIESSSDIFSSAIVIFGLRISKKPADENHPYGHGKIEPLSAMTVSLVLFIAAILIATHSFKALSKPSISPEPFTLIVLAVIIFIKYGLANYIAIVGQNFGSTSLGAEAGHHRADLITSIAAFIGISLSIIGGPTFQRADSVAALLASLIIAVNAIRLFRPAIYELLDTEPSKELITSVRKIAESVEGVHGTHKCHIRKLGFDHFVDLDILCNPDLTIRQGHEIAHSVGDAIRAKLPNITKVLVHVEPIDDYGRRL